MVVLPQDFSFVFSVRRRSRPLNLETTSDVANARILKFDASHDAKTISLRRFFVIWRLSRRLATTKLSMVVTPAILTVTKGALPTAHQYTSLNQPEWDRSTLSLQVITGPLSFSPTQFPSHSLIFADPQLGPARRLAI